MGDVSILIDKNGRVIDLTKKNNNTNTDTDDNEDGDDIDEDELSGSGSASLPTTPELPPKTTTTPIRQQLTKQDGGDSSNVAIIAAAVSSAVVILVIVIVLIVCLRRRRRKRLEKASSMKPLPHPASLDMSESSRTTLHVRPTGDGYYAPSAPIYHPPGAGDDLPPPTEPPPPPPTSKKSLNQSKPAKSARYTKLSTDPPSGAKANSENIYETIDDYSVTDPDDGQVYLMGVSPKAEDGDKGEDEYPYEETDKLKC